MPLALCSARRYGAAASHDALEACITAGSRGPDCASISAWEGRAPETETPATTHDLAAQQQLTWPPRAGRDRTTAMEVVLDRLDPGGPLGYMDPGWSRPIRARSWPAGSRVVGTSCATMTSPTAIGSPATG